MSYIGTNKVGGMPLGSTKIAKAYLGSNLVFEANGSLQPGQIPPNYTQLDWVNGNASGKISLANSNIQLSNTFDMEMKLTPIAYPSFINIVFAARGGYIGYTNGGKAAGGSGYSSSAVFALSTDAIVTAKFRSDSSASEYKVNGVDTGLKMPIQDTDFAIFGRPQDNVYRSNCKIYYIKIFDANDSSVILHDFVPCLDNNGIPCMFDIVSMKKASFNDATNVTYGTIS